MKAKKSIYKLVSLLCCILMGCLLLGGCSLGDADSESAVTEGKKESVAVEADTEVTDESASVEETADVPAEGSANAAGLADGQYRAVFETDSNMFHVNETCEGKGVLTVKNGEMTIHISLPSKSVLNLYCGLAEDAAKEGAVLLEPTVDTVTYSDGISEEVHGFDVPVPVIGEEFDLALIGTKGKWYDHKVSVKEPQPLDEAVSEEETEAKAADGTDATDATDAGASKDSGNVDPAGLTDGKYIVQMDFEGGSGKAYIESPVDLRVEDGKIYAILVWSSPNYDYMIVDGEKYLPINTEGNSAFKIPVAGFDQGIKVIGDTVAMSKPHEIEYVLTFHSDTLVKPE
ncbi:MAG: iron transporter [Lachnospiraceae bacterium]|nr:iron transporter [Lachnospiraceae bacterium]